MVLLACALHRAGMAVQVLTFYPGGALRAELASAGVPVIDLAKRGRWDVIPFLVRLVHALRRYRPDVLYSFLPVANILAVLARLFSGRTRVIWGVRASDMNLSGEEPIVRWVAYTEARLARFADKIIANSQAGQTYHITKGFPADKFVVVPNGIDTARFRFSAIGRHRIRGEWGVQNGELLVGIAARMDPMKGYETFLHAAALVASHRSDVRFACVGDGPEGYCKELVDLGEQLGIADKVIWASGRPDMPEVYSAFDIACSSSSYGEGFSNAVGEAMSCERVCVVTDVGDSARIVGETGRVVPAKEPSALAAALHALLLMDDSTRGAIGAAARKRIEENASVHKLLKETLAALEA